MFDLDGYNIMLAAVGVAIILAYWLPRFVSGREPAASGLLILLGLGIFALVPGMPAAIDPSRDPLAWEKVSELALIVSLFGTGLRIDRLVKGPRRAPTIRLLVLAMPLTIVAVAIAGWSFAGLPVAVALLMGAVLAPTDPVLAGDVQVGPPMEGGEHPVRLTLTAEAGLNDGLAFPFVHLALLAVLPGFAIVSDGAHWLGIDVAYRIAVGVASGVAIGWLLGRALFSFPRGNPLADTASGVVAFAGILLCYGATELVEGYGFIACFVAGVTLRRVEAEHDFHRRLHDFSESIEHALTAVLLVAVGAALPLLMPSLRWEHALIALALIFVIRPVVAWASLARTHLRPRERAVVAFYGVRGIGSIYYLAYAGSHVAGMVDASLWAMVALTILISTVVHGFSAGAVVERITSSPERRND